MFLCYFYTCLIKKKRFKEKSLRKNCEIIKKSPYLHINCHEKGGLRPFLWELMPNYHI